MEWAYVACVGGGALLVLLSAGGGFGVAAWGFQPRLDARDEEIARLRAALEREEQDDRRARAAAQGMVEAARAEGDAAGLPAGERHARLLRAVHGIAPEPAAGEAGGADPGTA